MSEVKAMVKDGIQMLKEVDVKTWQVVATGAAVAFGAGYVWLKRKLPAMDNFTEELRQHLALYDSDDTDKDETELTQKRNAQYMKLAQNYYNLSTDLIHIIWGPHYSTGLVFPVEPYKGKYQTYPAAQQMYQCYLALALQADDTMTIGDFGCGTGGPTRCIAQFTGAKIKAVNITQRHLDQMAEWNKEAGIDHRIEPVCTDYHATPFEDNSLDGVYMMESMGHSPDYPRLCREIFRVLKPGARFTGFNWDLKESFDENNPKHREIRVKLIRGVGMPQMVKMSDFAKALKAAGFEILCQRDHNDFGMSLGSKPWHFLLSERSARTSFLGPLFFLMNPLKNSIYYSLLLMEKIYLVSPGTTKAYSTIMASLRDGMREGIKEDIFTPMHFWCAQKPLK
jgi:sterol 24-C-methyltransferase